MDRSDGNNRSIIGALNCGLNIPGTVNLAGDDAKGMSSNAPLIFWLQSFDVSYSTNMSTAPWERSNSGYRQTGEIVISHEPDELGDFYAVKTYSYKVPYSDTTGRYCTILWANNVWFVNATSSSPAECTQTPYPRNNMYEYTLTCKTVLTREEES